MGRSRRRKRDESEGEGGTERWLLSYSDFITLLMVFFILMYSMSKVDVAKYNAIAESLSIILTGQSLQILETRGPSLAPGIAGQQNPLGDSQDLAALGQLEELKKQVQEFVNNDQSNNLGMFAEQSSTKLADYIEIIEQERGLVISIKDTILFTSGSDVLNPQARLIIKQLGTALVNIPNYIRVEGHTDNLPINTDKFPSNWELSELRASNVLHVLQQEVGIPPDRLSVIGYGEYRPLVPNINATNQAINRRVDIVILKQKYDEFEPPRMQTDITP